MRFDRRRREVSANRIFFFLRGSRRHHGITPCTPIGAAVRSIPSHIVHVVPDSVELVLHQDVMFFQGVDLFRGVVLHHLHVMVIPLQLHLEPRLFSIGLVETVEEFAIEVSFLFAHMSDCSVLIVPRVMRNAVDPRTLLRKQCLRLHGGSSYLVLLELVHFSTLMLERWNGLVRCFALSSSEVIHFPTKWFLPL